MKLFHLYNFLLSKNLVIGKVKFLSHRCKIFIHGHELKLKKKNYPNYLKGWKDSSFELSTKKCVLEQYSKSF